MPSRCKVLVPLTHFKIGDTVWPPVSVESLWAELQDSGIVKILNTPFFAKGLSYLDDISVEAQQSRDMLNFVEVVRHSGHSTIRAILLNSSCQSAAEAAIEAAEGLGCALETGGEFVAIDVPPHVRGVDVLAVLSDAADAGAIYVDVGFIAEPNAESPSGLS